MAGNLFFTQYSQCDTILAGLLAGLRLTALRALRLYGCGRLAARIWELRARGYRISDRHILVLRNDGTWAWVQEYYMKREAA